MEKDQRTALALRISEELPYRARFGDWLNEPEGPIDDEDVTPMRVILDTIRYLEEFQLLGDDIEQRPV